MEKGYITILNETIKNIQELKDKKEKTKSDNEKIELLKTLLSQLFDVYFKTEGLIDANQYVKITPLKIERETILDSIIINKVIKNKYVEKDVIFVELNTDEFYYNVVTKITIYPDWINFSSYAENYVFDESKRDEILELLNEYNSNTHHSKAVIKDNTIGIIRSDIIKHIWSNEDLSYIVGLSLNIARLFFVKNAEKLKTFVKMSEPQ